MVHVEVEHAHALIVAAVKAVRAAQCRSGLRLSFFLAWILIGGAEVRCESALPFASTIGIAAAPSLDLTRFTLLDYRPQPAITWRIHNQHALSLRYQLSRRDSLFRAAGEILQSRGTIGIFYALLAATVSAPAVGAIALSEAWRVALGNSSGIRRDSGLCCSR